MKTLFSSAFASLVLLASSAIADEQGFLGVSTAPAEGGKGLLVQEVTEGSGAEKAGIREGDVILRFAGKKPKDFDALAAAVRARKPGDKVEVIVLRDGEDQTFEVVLGKAPGEMEDQEGAEKGEAEESPGFLVETDEGEQKGAWLGIQHMTDEEGNLTIQEVIPGSPAKKAGLQKGDKILRFNGEPGSEIGQTIAACEPGQKVEIQVKRGEEEKTFTVKLAKKQARTVVVPRLRVETPRIEIPEIRTFRAPQPLRVERDDERMKEVLEEVRSLRKEIAELREMIEKLASRDR
ncbi:MAG: PDZ domain-containing protein [Planctomycetes bacterium]|nr:PDZ domain-containing protein [Planctomycetota bacterium]